MTIMYGRVFRKFHAKNSKAKGKPSDLATTSAHVPVSPIHNNGNDQQAPDESRGRWDEYESKSADMALFKLHTSATHHPIEPYERSISHDSIFALASTPPWGNTTLGLSTSTTSGQDNDSVDLTIFMDDDQSTATELCPIYRVRPSIVRSPVNKEEKVDDEDDRSKTSIHRNDRKKSDAAIANDTTTSRTYRGTNGCRSSLRRTHSGGLDPYLLPPPRFTRFEI